MIVHRVAVGDGADHGVVHELGVGVEVFECRQFLLFGQLLTLFEKSLVNYSAFQDYIEKFTANWDVERIVFMDNLIIGTAMAELTSFPSVPVKVTLDEWIEISKYYSTPGSSTFINGVLDKIVESLTAEGRIKKAGRGLI